MRYLPIVLLLSAALFAFDYYVFRNWRRNAGSRTSRWRWTIPVYRVLMVVMPLSLPLYFQFFRWWEVEPKLFRALLFGFWAVYYLPKVPIVVALLVKDAGRFVGWLFRRFQDEHAAASARLRGPTAAGAGSSGVRGASASAPRHADATSREGALHRPPSGPHPGTHTEVDARERSTAPPDLTDMKRISRAEFLRRMGWTAAAVPFVVTGYSVFRSLYDFTVHRVDIPLAGLPRAFDGLTIAQMSDLHAGSFFNERPMWEAVEMVNQLRPDLITITGDFVNHDVAEMSVIAPALNALDARLGIFGCLGNHDHYANVDRLVPLIRATRVDLLVNAHRTISVDGAELHVIGTDNTGFRQNYADLPRAVEGIDADRENTQILLAHDPTFWDGHVRSGYENIDLMLCGHTHGGQLGFEWGPFRWGLAKMVYDRWAGLYAEPRRGGESRQFLYVNRGLGTVGPPLRLGIRPEITLLTLHRT